MRLHFPMRTIAEHTKSTGRNLKIRAQQDFKKQYAFSVPGTQMQDFNRRLIFTELLSYAFSGTFEDLKKEGIKNYNTKTTSTLLIGDLVSLTSKYYRLVQIFEGEGGTWFLYAPLWCA